MCTHGKWVRNPYTHENIFVKCGSCRSCQLEKAAAKFSRIMNHEAAPSGYFRVFVTLNYSNQSLPYILMDEVEKSPYSFKVYRRSRFYYVRAKHGFSRLIRETGRFEVAIITPNSSDINGRYMQSYEGLQLPSHWKYERRAVGVALSLDFSNFLSRLKKRLLRTYNLNVYNNVLTYFKVQEYGPTTKRPHFHAILYFPKEWSAHYFKIKRAIISSWPFCSARQISENVGIAMSGQQYVSSYTCRPSDYPSFFKVRSISQKSSFSRGFGFGRVSFSPSSFFDMFKHRDFSYTYTSFREGKAFPIVSSIPKYVVRRYLPYIKGLSRIDCSQIHGCLSTFDGFFRAHQQLGLSLTELPIYWNRILRASSLLNMSLYDYSLFYQSCLNVLNAYNYGCFLDSVKLEDPLQVYDNFSEIYPIVQRTGVVYTDVYPIELYFKPFSSLSYVSDPNTFSRNVIRESENELKYNEYEKKAKYNSYVNSLRTEYITYEIKTLNYGKCKEKPQLCGKTAEVRT